MSKQDIARNKKGLRLQSSPNMNRPREVKAVKQSSRNERVHGAQFIQNKWERRQKLWGPNQNKSEMKGAEMIRMQRPMRAISDNVLLNQAIQY